MLAELEDFLHLFDQVLRWKLPSRKIELLLTEDGLVMCNLSLNEQLILEGAFNRIQFHLSDSLLYKNSSALDLRNPDKLEEKTSLLDSHDLMAAIHEDQMERLSSHLILTENIHRLANHYLKNLSIIIKIQAEIQKQEALDHYWEDKGKKLYTLLEFDFETRRDGKGLYLRLNTKSSLYKDDRSEARAQIKELVYFLLDDKKFKERVIGWKYGMPEDKRYGVDIPLDEIALKNIQLLASLNNRDEIGERIGHLLQSPKITKPDQIMGVLYNKGNQVKEEQHKEKQPSLGVKDTRRHRIIMSASAAPLLSSQQVKI